VRGECECVEVIVKIVQIIKKRGISLGESVLSVHSLHDVLIVSEY
jgi:hypothetical protein